MAAEFRELASSLGIDTQKDELHKLIDKLDHLNIKRECEDIILEIIQFFESYSAA